MNPRLISAFYAEPWLIKPGTHKQLGAGLQAYLTNGRAPVYAMGERGGSPAPPGVAIESGIAFLMVSGVIGKHLSLLDIECSDVYDIALLERQVEDLMAREDVTTVVFQFNTPGGHAAGVQDVADLIVELGETKRTIAWVDVEACSAGYMLACACGEVYSIGTGILGSISAYIALIDQSRAFELQGLELRAFTDGELKLTGMPGKPVEDHEAAFLQERVEEVGGAFKAFVASRRAHIPAEAMDGRWLSGAGALDAGLADDTFPSMERMLMAVL